METSSLPLGLHQPLAGSFACTPNDLRPLARYALMQLLNKTEHEEAFARIIFVLLDVEVSDAWYGISLSRLHEQVSTEFEDVKAEETYRKDERTFRDKALTFQGAIQWRTIYNLFTFGWYGKNHPHPVEPTPPVKPVPCREVPYSHALTLHGGQALQVIVHSLQQMEALGYIHIERLGETEEEQQSGDFIVIRATPALVNIVAQSGYCKMLAAA